MPDKDANGGRAEDGSTPVSRRRALKAIGAGAGVIGGLHGSVTTAGAVPDIFSEAWSLTSNQYFYDTNGLFDIFVYPRLDVSSSVKDEIVDALKTGYTDVYLGHGSFDPLHRIRCFVHTGYVYESTNGDNWFDQYESFYNASSPGVHLLIDPDSTWANAEGGDATAFGAPVAAWVGTAGPIGLARSLAMQETLHQVVDPDQITDLVNDGNPHHEEHRLGTLDGSGAARPMTALYEGSQGYHPDDDLDDRVYWNEGAQRCRSDGPWNGEWTAAPSDCTIEAVHRTRDSV